MFWKKEQRIGIETLAVALYESRCREVGAKGARPDWLALRFDDRKEWRMRAKRLITEEKI